MLEPLDVGGVEGGGVGVDGGVGRGPEPLSLPLSPNASPVISARPASEPITLDEPAWIDREGLAQLDNKVRVFLLDVGSSGYSVVFQQDGFLNVVEVLSRREPEVVPLDEAIERVVAAYRDRHAQELFLEVVEDLLTEHDFQYHRGAALKVLESQPTPAAR